MNRGFGPDVDIARAVYVDPSVRLYGRVRCSEGVSLWPNVVARAEVHEIRIGAYSNVQDFVMMHVAYGGPTIVGAHCSITHHVTLHGCTVEDNCLIGINATLMDGCVIGANSIVAGHALVSEGTIVPPGSIVAGIPAKVIRTRDNYVANRLNAWMYYRNALAYARGHFRAWDDSTEAAAAREEEARLRAER